jgi:hypothetical protein
MPLTLRQAPLSRGISRGKAPFLLERVLCRSQLPRGIAPRTLLPSERAVNV